ncbi:MAG: hypothetical protein FD167_3743 [bacterium]|nr:MAG: hypothetical protein FD167_3743 [bacterium]
MSQNNIKFTETTEIKGVSAVSHSYKEFLYDLLQDSDMEKEYLAVCKEDTEDPQAYQVALRNVEEARKSKKAKKQKSKGKYE